MVDDLRNGGTAVERRGASTPRPSRTTTSASSQSAELTGRLDETLESLAGYLEREIETRAKVVSALSYPGVVMVHGDVHGGDPRRLRAAAVQAAVRRARTPTCRCRRACMLFVATLFTDLWYIPLICSAAVLRRRSPSCSMHPSGKETGQGRLVLKIPIIKGIVEYAILERFCRILARDGQGRRAAARRR